MKLLKKCEEKTELERDRERGEKCKKQPGNLSNCLLSVCFSSSLLCKSSLQFFTFLQFIQFFFFYFGIDDT